MVCLGESGTLLREVLPADNGSALVVSWLRLRGETGGELLHYVLEWAGGAVVEPQWKRLAYDQNSTSITGTDHFPGRVVVYVSLMGPQLTAFYFILQLKYNLFKNKIT